MISETDGSDGCKGAMTFELLVQNLMSLKWSLTACMNLQVKSRKVNKPKAAVMITASHGNP